MTNKTYNLIEHQKQLRASEAMFNLIQLMPDDCPRIYHHSPICGGHMYYISTPEVKLKLSEMYGTENWHKFTLHRAPAKICVEWVKVLEGGITIHLESAETVDDTVLIFGQLVQLSEFGSAVELVDQAVS